MLGFQESPQPTWLQQAEKSGAIDKPFRYFGIGREERISLRSRGHFHQRPYLSCGLGCAFCTNSTFTGASQSLLSYIILLFHWVSNRYSMGHSVE